MDLKGLKDEIKRLKKIQNMWLKNHNTESIADKKLQGIKETIEAIDEDGKSIFAPYSDEWNKLWEEIKNLLNLTKGGR